MLIKGEHLTAHQREQVKAAYIYRWTVENKQRETVYRGLSKPRIPLQSDADWIVEHAFHFLRDGSRLMANRRFAEPVYMAE